eukprot:scaffold10179_cov75-Phaeocystis_antarctica.AAC.1
MSSSIDGVEVVEVQIQIHSLALIRGELLQPHLAALAPVTRLLDATKRRARRARLAVDLDHARTQRTRDAAHARCVGSLHVAGEAVLGVVGEGDGLLLAVEGREAEHLVRRVGAVRPASCCVIAAAAGVYAYLRQSTGPKISSRKMVACGGTSAKMVGRA